MRVELGVARLSQTLSITLGRALSRVTDVFLRDGLKPLVSIFFFPLFFLPRILDLDRTTSTLKFHTTVYDQGLHNISLKEYIGVAQLKTGWKLRSEHKLANREQLIAGSLFRVCIGQPTPGPMRHHNESFALLMTRRQHAFYQYIG